MTFLRDCAVVVLITGVSQMTTDLQSIRNCYMKLVLALEDEVAAPFRQSGYIVIENVV